jgi:1-acyl-sn-glycerol-3-phosphate acyltransferase
MGLCNPFSSDAGSADCLWNWLAIIAAWTVLNVGPAWYCIFKHGHRKPILDPNDKFKPFNRTDTGQWSYVWALFTHFFFLPRYLIGYGIVICSMLMAWVCSIGYDKRTKPSRVRQALWNFFVLSSARASIWMIGCY